MQTGAVFAEAGDITFNDFKDKIFTSSLTPGHFIGPLRCVMHALLSWMLINR